jgi:hypothetical protein
VTVDEIVARCRHEIDIITASFGRLSKTDIATLVLTAHLDGQCDALESDDIMAGTPDERVEYVRMLRTVADRLQPGAPHDR